jgi:hypothetical protein
MPAFCSSSSAAERGAGGFTSAGGVALAVPPSSTVAVGAAAVFGVLGGGVAGATGFGGGGDAWRVSIANMASAIKTTTMAIVVAMRLVGGLRDRPSVGMSDMRLKTLR